MNDILRLPLRDQLREHHRHNDHGAMRAVAIKMIDEGTKLEVIQDDNILYDREDHSKMVSWNMRKTNAVRIGGIAIPVVLTTWHLVHLAIDCAEAVLPVWENKFPDDDRPRLAIEAAKSGQQRAAARAAFRARRLAKKVADAGGMDNERAAWAAGAASAAADAMKKAIGIIKAGYPNNTRSVLESVNDAFGAALFADFPWGDIVHLLARRVLMTAPEHGVLP